jgi:nucleotide-binding universal stress UspA family protein
VSKKILLPLDGSKAGEVILSRLDELVFKEIRRADMEITLLRVVPIVNFNVLTTDERAQLPYSEAEKRDLTESAYSYLDKVAETLRSNNFKVNTVVKIGRAAKEIVETAHSINASLIAMSTRGRSGIVKWATGSVTEEVTKMEKEIPVLAVDTSKKGNNIPVLSIDSLQSLIKHT